MNAVPMITFEPLQTKPPNNKKILGPYKTKHNTIFSNRMQCMYIMY
jgi:hypothetical protein